MKTYQPTKKEVKRNWLVLDAASDSLGRIATQAAVFLMGKHKPTYSAHMDSGDNVVIVNCEGVILTGKKAQQKVYRSHSGYPGGLREVSFEKMLAEKPLEVVRLAVWGMLPDNKLRSKRMIRLKLIKGSENPYSEKLKK